MPTCFVIQPFDNGMFDKRYSDIFEPAIRAAGLDPYRVDRDSSTVVPIEDIAAGIRRSLLCFAEISTNNPNVWYELGFAFASGKHVEMVCSQPRDRFPFDVQHRYIIRCNPEAPSDFKALGDEITTRLKAAIGRVQELSDISTLTPAVVTEGLSVIEVAALVVVAQKLDALGLESDHTIRQEMANAGFTDIAVTLALRGLKKKGLVESEVITEWNDHFTAYRPTEDGFQWLERNQSLLTLNVAPKEPRNDGGSPDEVPF